jgi:hypothetical protein
MPETLLSPSNILLYGRVLADVLLQHPHVQPSPPSASSSGESGESAASSDTSGNPDGGPEDVVPPPPDAPPKLGENTFLQKQLTVDAANEQKRARLARIYGFSYEGHYYDLARPAIFLVHGPGSDPEAFRPGTERLESRGDRAPADADRTGIAYTASSFSHDMRVWSYDKGDFSIRLDPDNGTFEQILLQVELQTERVQSHYSGQRTRLRGTRGSMGD